MWNLGKFTLNFKICVISVKPLCLINHRHSDTIVCCCFFVELQPHRASEWSFLFLHTFLQNQRASWQAQSQHLSKQTLIDKLTMTVISQRWCRPSFINAHLTIFYIFDCSVDLLTPSSPKLANELWTPAHTNLDTPSTFLLTGFI